MANDKKWHISPCCLDLPPTKWNRADMAAFMQATMIDQDGCWLDLLCPRCQCDKIVCANGKPDIGNDAKCYECGYEFVITQNCWKLNAELNRKFDE